MRPLSLILSLGLALLSLASTSSGAGKAVATADGETPDTRAEITELKRTSGDQVMLRFTIVNESAKPFLIGGSMAEAGQNKDFATISGVHLLDTTNKKKHFVLRDTEGHCVCSKGLKDIKPKESINVWARFPAPPDGAKVTVVIPHFVPADDVAISR
jgi:hypothetical protein